MLRNSTKSRSLCWRDCIDHAAASSGRRLQESAVGNSLDQNRQLPWHRDGETGLYYKENMSKWWIVDMLEIIPPKKGPNKLSKTEKVQFCDPFKTKISRHFFVLLQWYGNYKKWWNFCSVLCTFRDSSNLVVLTASLHSVLLAVSLRVPSCSGPEL